MSWNPWPGKAYWSARAWRRRHWSRRSSALLLAKCLKAAAKPWRQPRPALERQWNDTLLAIRYSGMLPRSAAHRGAMLTLWTVVRAYWIGSV